MGYSTPIVTAWGVVGRDRQKARSLSATLLFYNISLRHLMLAAPDTAGQRLSVSYTFLTGHCMQVV